MKNKIISLILYFISFLSILFYLYILFINRISINPLLILLYLLIICFLTYFGGYFWTLYNKDDKNIIYRLNLIIWFILYVILLLNMTFLNTYFFRNGFIIVKWNKVVLYDYYYNVVNFIPFKMIIKFIVKLINHEMELSMFIRNIFGNFIACMPFAFFLPRLFRKENNIKTFLITMFIIVSIIEITQFITLSGTFDIDDYILNISGAYLMFNILKMKKINLLIDKILKKNS